jgi:hypothetical protein
MFSNSSSSSRSSYRNRIPSNRVKSWSSSNLAVLEVGHLRSIPCCRMIMTWLSRLASLRARLLTPPREVRPTFTQMTTPFPCWPRAAGARRLPRVACPWSRPQTLITWGSSHCSRATWHRKRRQRWSLCSYSNSRIRGKRAWPMRKFETNTFSIGCTCSSRRTRWVKAHT